MDPLAALMQCDQAISDCDHDAACDALDAYHDWRSADGFEPADVYGKRGDAFAKECARRMTDLRRAQADDDEAPRVGPFGRR